MGPCREEIAIARSATLGKGSPQSSAASGASRLKWKLTAAREVARQVNNSSSAAVAPLALNASTVETIKSGGAAGGAGSKVGEPGGGRRPLLTTTMSFVMSVMFFQHFFLLFSHCSS